jgi:hypothetical protein
VTATALEGHLPDLATPECFMVLWQDPHTRLHLRVGTLSRVDGEYAFHYERALPAGFPGFPSFPELAQEYHSPHLFPLFANRVMTPRREGYAHYLGSLGLAGDSADPFEVLARTLGARATDRVQVLPIPPVTPAGVVSLRFLVHGWRYVDPEAERLRNVRPGDRLELVPEPRNEVSDRAVLVGPEGTHDRHDALGYVPDALTPLIHELWRVDSHYRVTAEHVNLPGASSVADRMRLLARLDALCPEGTDPTSVLGR